MNGFPNDDWSPYDATGRCRNLLGHEWVDGPGLLLQHCSRCDQTRNTIQWEEPEPLREDEFLLHQDQPTYDYPEIRLEDLTGPVDTCPRNNGGPHVSRAGYNYKLGADDFLSTPTCMYCYGPMEPKLPNEPWFT